MSNMDKQQQDLMKVANSLKDKCLFPESVNYARQMLNGSNLSSFSVMCKVIKSHVDKKGITIIDEYKPISVSPCQKY